jgi:hypothetical protein
MAEIRRLFAAPLAARLGRSVEELTLPDGSTMLLRYAFAVADGDVVGVFSEHCGYHVFAEVRVTVLRDGQPL